MELRQPYCVLAALAGVVLGAIVLGLSAAIRLAGGRREARLRAQQGQLPDLP